MGFKGTPVKGLSQNKKREPLNKVGKNRPSAQDDAAQGRASMHGWLCTVSKPVA